MSYQTLGGVPFGEHEQIEALFFILHLFFDLQ